MPVIYGSNPSEILRAPDGVTFVSFVLDRTRDGSVWPPVPDAIWSGEFTVGQPLETAPRPMLMGPRDRLYWKESAGTIKQTNGMPPVSLMEGAAPIDGSPAATIVYGMFFNADSYATDDSRVEPTDDRLYFGYITSDTLFRVAYWSGTAWTLLPVGSRSLATGSGALGLIPAGVDSGDLLVAWENDSLFPGTRNVVQRWDGAAWTDELYLNLNNLSTILRNIIPWGSTSVLLLGCDNANPGHVSMIHQRSAAGVWVDISPTSWDNDAVGVQWGNNVDRFTCGAIEYEGDLYVAWRDENYTRTEIWKRTTPLVAVVGYPNADPYWTLDLDLIAEGTGANTAPLSLTVIDGDLYVGCESYGAGSGFEIDYLLIKRGGSWIRQSCGSIDTTISYLVESLEGTVVPPSGNTSGVYSPTIRVRAFWDRPRAFSAWSVGTEWLMGVHEYRQFVRYDDVVADPTSYGPLSGLWYFRGSLAVGGPGLEDLTSSTIVNLGSTSSPFGGIDPPISDPLLDINYGQTIHTCGKVDVVDALVLTCRPPNGKSFANINMQDDYYELEEDPTTYHPDLPLAPGNGLIYTRKLATGRIPLCYEFVCPDITGIAPASGDILGGNVVILTGTNLFSNQVRDGQHNASARYRRLYNQVYVRNAAGRMEIANSDTVEFIDTEHVSFVVPPFPGGSSPIVTVIFEPAGLRLFGSSSHNFRGTYRCPADTIPYTYTNVSANPSDLYILGSLDTVLGLGGEGGDIDIPPPINPPPPPPPPPELSVTIMSNFSLARRLANLCERILYRLGDSDQRIWDEAEIDTYIQEAAFQMVDRTRLVWDQLFLEDIPPGFDHTHSWEVGLLEYEFNYGEASYNYEWEVEYGVAANLWYEEDVSWANHTSPADIEHLDDADIDQQHATAELSNSLVEIDRATWDNNGIPALSPRHLSEVDTRYEITRGEVHGFTWRKDGPRTFRKVRVPNAMAAVITHEGSWGIARNTEAAYPDDLTGMSWGIPRRITSYHPMGKTVGFGMPRRFYQDGRNVKVEHWRKFDAECGMTDLKDGVERRLAGEIPRHYFMYMADYCQMKALRRNGPGQNYKLAQLYSDRWERDIARIKNRVNRKQKQRVSRMGGNDPSPRGGPPRPRLPWQYGSKIR